MYPTTHSTIHRRFKEFVPWIAPLSDAEDAYKETADALRELIKKKATEEGYTIAEMPYSGSFAKKTGLRRHLLGYTTEEGQDVDIAFIFEPFTRGGKPVREMVIKLRDYLRSRYPDSDVVITKSSANIQFKSKRITFDLVPMVKSERPNIQYLYRTDGEKRQTSVHKHVEFIKSRNRSSAALSGVVSFNQCVRLVKWWRTTQQANGRSLGTTNGKRKVSSFLITLLCAYAYDKVGVKATYHETLTEWFRFLKDVVANRTTIAFSDYGQGMASRGNALWMVADPMDSSNNIVAKWTEPQLRELALWFTSAYQHMLDACNNDLKGNDSASMNSLVLLFGNAFKHQTA